jgi:DNA-binding MarR family transcriptional regulator
MTIEEAIHQKKFDNEYEKLVINILFTASWLEGKNIQRFKPYGISPQQFNVLRILRGAHPHPVRLSDITERMIDKNSNATRLVEKLRQKGFLKRDICPTNRRQVDILILNKGLEILKEIDVEMKNSLKEYKAITKTEAMEINTLLDKLRS